LFVSQPQGPSFRVEGQEVRWQNWAFRFQMHPREGLVLYQVRYLDHGRWRQVLYRASLAEMMVPYGHNDDHWTWRAAFDEGEYGIGRYSGSLEVGTDVPPNARLFDALFVDDFGMPYSTKNAVALYERDGGLLWKHFDMYAGGNVSRRGRDLVIGFITTISNYDYGLNWVFREDGSLELEAQLLAKGVELEVTPEAREWLALKGYDRFLGARPLSRVIQDRIKKPLAEEILFGKLEGGGEVRISVDAAGEPAFEIRTKPGRAAESEPVSPETRHGE
jgi:primary-amine oxidase